MKDLLRILLIVLKLIAKNDGVVHKFVELMNKNAQFDFNDIVKENEEANTFNSYQENCALRIVGGVNAPISKVPYQVVLRRSSKNGLLWFSFCGGSLVTLSFLLSASHCFDFPDFYKWKNKVRAVAGTEITDANLFTFRKEHSRRIKHYYIHRNYSAADWKNDISVLEVQHPFIESENIKPIRMHTPDMKVNLSIGSICLVSGFGLLENDQRSKRLQMVCVPLVSSSKCSEMYMQPIFSFNLCAGEYTKDSCGGDSGGPLVCSGVLVGLVSWGSVCGAYPGVYTRLASYTGEKTVPFMKKAGNNLEASLYLIIVTILCIFDILTALGSPSAGLSWNKYVEYPLKPFV